MKKVQRRNRNQRKETLRKRMWWKDTSAVTSHLLNWFYDYGLPEQIRSDSGPQFRDQFTAFCDEHGISHETSSAHHHPSNGHAEAGVKSMKMLLAKCQSFNKFKRVMFKFRNVPRSADDISPA